MSRPAFRNTGWMAVSFGVLLLATATHAADLLILSGSGGEFVRECTQKDVVISGSKSKFVLTGGCQSLSVPGDGNQILVDMAAGSEIYLRGNDNDIAWTKSRDAAGPAIVTDGQSNNIVELGTEAPRTGPLAENNSPSSIAQPTATPPSAPGVTGANEPKMPLENQAQSTGRRLAASDFNADQVSEVKAGVMHDLHSAVSKSVRHCQQHRRNDSVCKFLAQYAK